MIRKDGERLLVGLLEACFAQGLRSPSPLLLVGCCWQSKLLVFRRAARRQQGERQGRGIKLPLGTPTIRQNSDIKDTTAEVVFKDNITCIFFRFLSFRAFSEIESVCIITFAQHHMAKPAYPAIGWPPPRCMASSKHFTLSHSAAWSRSSPSSQPEWPCSRIFFLHRASASPMHRID